MNIKKLICTAAAAALAVQPVFAAQSANVVVNGKQISDEAYLINDKTYVPLRAVGESFGAHVSWDDASGTAYVNLSEDDAVTNVIENASDSVVAIVGNCTPEYLSAQASSYNTGYAHGTGVVIKSGGVILTNAHVVKDIQNITVIFSSGESYPGTVQNIDEKSDLAVVKINKLGLKPITFGKAEDIKVGSTVIAIGTPLSLSRLNSASKGIVSGKNVNIGEYYYFTQSDVSINGGNSGGPLINLKGELIGINSKKSFGIGVEGMSYSIPIDTVNYILREFETNKEVIRPEINAVFTESWEAKLGLPTPKGLTVKSSGTENLKPGDTVISVNGIDVHSITDLNEALKKTYTKNSSVSLKVTRGSETLDIKEEIK